MYLRRIVGCNTEFATSRQPRMHLKSTPEIVHIICAAALLVVLPFYVLPARADSNAEPAVTSTLVEKNKPNPNMRVCKRVKPTGSHIRRRVCLKQKQWDEMREAAQKSLEGTMQIPSGGEQG